MDSLGGSCFAEIGGGVTINEDCVLCYQFENMAPLSALTRREEAFVQWKDSGMSQNSQKSGRCGITSVGNVTSEEGPRGRKHCSTQSNSSSRKVRACASGSVPVFVKEKLPEVIVGVKTHGVPEVPSAGHASTSSALPHIPSSSEGTHGRMGSMSQENGQLRRVVKKVVRNSDVVLTKDADVASEGRNRNGGSRLMTTSQERGSKFPRSSRTTSTTISSGHTTPLSEEVYSERNGRRSSGGSVSYPDLHGRAYRKSGEKFRVQSPSTERTEGNRRVIRKKSHRTSGQAWKDDVDFISGSEGEDLRQRLEESEDESVDALDGASEDLARAFTFYSEDGDGHISGDIGEDEEGEADEEEHGIENHRNNSDGIEDEYPTETEKRKQRRHEMNARLREGDRRHAEGLPRNFLLVDEYTKEPYGQGVGSWRKELMGLSKSLDPAIGNINRQPDDGVKEVAEWIQHTWEYERPVKWEIVKEVIARGVSLRRVKLWNLLRMGKERPDGVSDCSWRSLSHQMKSPAMIQKSQNCSKANASRMNFGRTGPSGQVGVRERLRKKLKRSPSPDEIRREMERPKGYEGISKRKEKLMYIMHGSGDEAFNVERTRGNTSGNEGNGDLPLVMSLSENQVAQHPSFIRIMQRLEALESRGKNAAMQCEAVDSLHIPAQMMAETNDNVEVEDEVVRESGESDSATAIRRSGRLKEKANMDEGVAMNSSK